MIKKINKLKHQINNKILIGTLDADKYLHPTGWRSSYKELKDWLNKYHDHPDAYKIYRLALRRKPIKSKLRYAVAPEIIVSSNGRGHAKTDGDGS